MADTVTNVEDEDEVVDANAGAVVDGEEIEENADEAAPEAVLELSDEEFEKQMNAATAAAAAKAAEPVTDETEDVDGSAEVKDPVAEDKPAKKPAAKADVKPKTPKEDTTDKVPVGTDFDPLGVEDTVAVAAYKELFAPFKANGKTIQVKTPQEALRLMQMGAGHVKYQNSVKPALAQAKTLENHNIGPDELNFLIDLHNKNPEAIKKLVRDANIDPYDIVVDDNAKAADKTYRSKNYSATEEQVTLEETLADVRSHPEGPGLLTSMRSEWDDESRRIVMADPKILPVLVEQRESGIYAKIAAEIDRRMILGELPKMPFMRAYHQVGVEMTNAGAFNQTTPVTEKPAARSKVIERKAGAVPKTTSNDKAVKAIAPIKTVVTAKPDLSNIMDMPDDEFAKIANL